MFKATLVGTVLAAFFIPVVIVGLPFIEFFNDMAAQPKAKTQGTYGRIYGQQLQTERIAVPGTVPRHGGETYPFTEFGKQQADEQTADAGVDAPGKAPKVDLELRAAKQVGALWTNPVPRTPEAFAEGKELYDIFCITCHGNKGQADGPAVGADRFPAPPSFHTDRAREFTDGAVYHFITQGYQKMPSYADKLDPTERWMTIHYIRALQRAMNPEPKDLAK